MLFLIFLLINFAAAYGAYVTSDLGQGIYLYATVSAQAFFVIYLIILLHKNAGIRGIATPTRKLLKSIVMLVLLVSLPIGFIYWLAGKNDTNHFLTYSALTCVSAAAFWSGFSIVSKRLMQHIGKYLIAFAVFDVICGFARLAGLESYARSSVGISRNGLWLLYLGKKWLFVAISLCVFFFVATNGMRIGILSFAVYLIAMIFIVNKNRRTFFTRAFIFTGSIALGLILFFSIIENIPKDSMPENVEKFVSRVQNTFDSFGNDYSQKVNDGRDDESIAALDELNISGSFSELLVGRGAGFTYYNPRIDAYASHIHFGYTRLLTRHGWLGTGLIFVVVAFVFWRFFLTIFSQKRFDILYLSFAHYFAFFLFFGEDVFPLFWFSFGCAVANLELADENELEHNPIRGSNFKFVPHRRKLALP